MTLAVERSRHAEGRDDGVEESSLEELHSSIDACFQVLLSVGERELRRLLEERTENDVEMWWLICEYLSCLTARHSGSFCSQPSRCLEVELWRTR